MRFRWWENSRSGRVGRRRGALYAARGPRVAIHCRRYDPATFGGQYTSVRPVAGRRLREPADPRAERRIPRRERAAGGNRRRTIDHSPNEPPLLAIAPNFVILRERPRGARVRAESWTLPKDL
jgi:hypothetical protein